jgi:redox-sensitive bicupin YhaK (pirin superfamily)
MSKCTIKKIIRGQRAVDGAGVHLVRVLGSDDMKDFDPFLMLDSFDSVNPSDYTAGFPMHPHRGIETITYLIAGEIEHQDSLGNKGSIHSGETQWMTAGSGILHQEMPQASDRMLGIQLWLNLPQNEKMTEPAYFSITEEMIAKTKQEDAEIKVISGTFGSTAGIVPKHIPATIYDIVLTPGKELVIPVKNHETVFIFLIEGDAILEGKRVPEKSAILYNIGDEIAVLAPEDSASRVLFFSGKPLHEPIAWGGPIVMNTQEELQLAFEELRKGTFIK